MSKYEEISSYFLGIGIQEDIVNKLIEEYKVVKKGALHRDVEKVSLHSGKFSDMALAFVKNYYAKTPVDINKIKTDDLIKELVNSKKTTPEDVIFTLAIPRAVRSIHSIRNKKDVAHVKSIDPDSFDIHYCETSCDWILSQLVCLVYGADSVEAKKIIESLCEKKVPWMQEFEDGSILLLLPDLALKDQILLTLYHNYPNRMMILDLARIINYTNQTYLKSILDTLQHERLVHMKPENLVWKYIITRLGEKRVEEILEGIIES